MPPPSPRAPRATSQSNRSARLIHPPPASRPTPASHRPVLASSGTPAAPQTTLPPLYSPSATPAPTDLVLFRNTLLGGTATNEQTSVTDEPSVANNGNFIFYTGNFYAALSRDWGETFGYIDPATSFPSIYGGFCCDQRTIYIPSRDLTVWTLLYGPDADNNNAVRLAVARGQGGLARNEWIYWDLTAQSAEIPAGFALDYPQLAYSSNDLYLTADVHDSSGAPAYSVIFRCSLDDLATLPAGSPLTCTNFWQIPADTYTPVDGATTTMYWAAHADNQTLFVYSWPESVDWDQVSWTPVSHSLYPTGPFTCPGPDGTDMCASDYPTVRGGWLANGVLGFLWDAAQGAGGLGSFPYPYVHVVRIDVATLHLIDEPIIWSNTNAWADGAVAVDSRGGLGVSVAYAGGGNNPGSAVMVLDDVSPAAWQPLNVQLGTNGPPQNRWGDFLTVRSASGSGTTWLATAYTLQGTCSDNWAPCPAVQPRFLWFGRQRDDPLAPFTSASRFTFLPSVQTTSASQP